MPKSALLLGLVVVIGLFFRLYHFSSVPLSLYWDEAAMLLDAKVLAATGKDMHGEPWWQLIFPSYGDYKLPIYIWLSTLMVKLVGVSQAAVRLPSLLAGLMTLPAVWYVCKGISNLLGYTQYQKWAWASVVVILLSPWSILFSRTGFESHLAQAFLAWSLVVWLHGVLLSKKPSKSLFFWGNVVLSAALGLLASYTYFALRFVWPVVLVSASLLLSVSKREWKRTTIATLIAVVAGYVGFLPMINSPLYDESTRLRLGTDSLLNTERFAIESNVMREIAGNTVIDRVFFHRSLLLLQGLAKNYADHFSWQYIFMEGDPNLRHGTGVFGLFLLPFAVLPFVGLARIRGQWWRVGAWLGIWWLAAVLPAAVPTNTPHALRSLSGLVPASLALGGCLALAYTWVTSTRATFSFKYVIASVWLCWLSASILAFGWYYFRVYPAVSSPHWQYGYTELAQAIVQNHKQFNHPVVVATFDDRFFLWQLTQPEYAPETISAMKHNQYRIVSTAPEQIWFEEIPQMKEWAATKYSFGVAGTPGQIEEWQKNYNVTFEITHTISSPTGEVLYIVARSLYE